MRERETTSFLKQEEGEAASVSCGGEEVSKDVIGSIHFVKVSVQTRDTLSLPWITYKLLYSTICCAILKIDLSIHVKRIGCLF